MMAAENSLRFETGECVLYGARAVCYVKSIGPLPFGSDKRKQYYTLRPVFEAHGETIYAPIESRISIRRVMTPVQAENCIASAATVPPAAPDDAAAQSAALQSQDCALLLACIKALRHREAEAKCCGKRPREADKRFLEHAEKLLYGELAAALSASPEEVKARVEAHFGL